jgi:hypothetical protein
VPGVRFWGLVTPVTEATTLPFVGTILPEVLSVVVVVLVFEFELEFESVVPEPMSDDMRSFAAFEPVSVELPNSPLTNPDVEVPRPGT